MSCKTNPTLTVSGVDGPEDASGRHTEAFLDPFSAYEPDATGQRRRRSFIQFASEKLHMNRRKSAMELGQQLDQEDWDERAVQLISSNGGGDSEAPANGGSNHNEVFDFEIPSQDAQNQAALQHGIDLYEQGNVEESTELFRQLADSVPVAQVLYGLALRHGWGCDKDPEKAFAMLERAAKHSAQDMEAGLGQDKNSQVQVRGEMVLAIYELGNSFRNGWGCKRDDRLAKTYYETAARLGDVDAMVATAQCYLQGIGTKKNKYLAALYYRFAEERGHVEVSNSWIWKSKYDTVKSTAGIYQ